MALRKTRSTPDIFVNYKIVFPAKYRIQRAIFSKPTGSLLLSISPAPYSKNLSNVVVVFNFFFFFSSLAKFSDFSLYFMSSYVVFCSIFLIFFFFFLLRSLLKSVSIFFFFFLINCQNSNPSFTNFQLIQIFFIFIFRSDICSISISIIIQC